MQQLLNVLTKADSYDLMSLEEMKTMLLIPDTDTSKDALLTELITNVSETVARLCNRVFGYEEVDETFYQLDDQAPSPMTRRLYLTRWPVVVGDIEIIEQSLDGSQSWNDLLPEQQINWILEEETGTLYARPENGPWFGTVHVKYKGGYKLPDEAPGALKFAAMGVTREGYMAWIRNPTLYGIRQLAHKESRVGYYPPNMFTTLGQPETWKQVQSVLQHYIRHWV